MPITPGTPLADTDLPAATADAQTNAAEIRAAIGALGSDDLASGTITPKTGDLDLNNLGGTVDNEAVNDAVATNPANTLAAFSKVNTAAVAPTAANDSTQGYAPSSKWTDSVTGKVYWCMDATAENAVWVAETTAWTGYFETRQVWLRGHLSAGNKNSLPLIEAPKLAGPTAFPDRARVIAGDVRVISMGASLREAAIPIPQLIEAYSSKPQSPTDGNLGYFSNSSGSGTFANGATFTSATDRTLNVAGHLLLPATGIFTATERMGTGFVMGYVKEPGAGSLFIEVSTDAGTTWTAYTATIDCNAATSYETLNLTGQWDLGPFRFRLTATGGAVRIPFLAPVGAFSHYAVGFPSSTAYENFNTTNLLPGTMEAFYAAYDPDIIFYYHSNSPDTYPADFETFVERITDSCPNAQVIILGRWAGNSQSLRDQHGERKETNEIWVNKCRELPNFSFVDVWDWFPNQTESIAAGLLDGDGHHLTAAGYKLAQSLVWESMRPYLFPRPGIPTARNDWRARTIFERAGWTQTAILANDVIYNTDNSLATTKTPLFEFAGLPSRGWFELDLTLKIESTATARASVGIYSLATYNVSISLLSDSVREGGYVDHTGAAYFPLAAPVGRTSSNLIFPGTAFDATASTVIYRGKVTFCINGGVGMVPALANIIRVLAAQTTSTAVDTKFKRGSTATLRRINVPIGNDLDHSQYIAP